ncbi:transmembrane and immunoglobulin domain-containing protein 1 [Rhynchocyon petersi]
MVQARISLMETCRFLLLVTLFLPCEMKSSVLTVNGKTEDYVLHTTSDATESLECAVQHHTGDEELLWFRKDGRVDLKSENKINSSSICVSPVREDDNGVTFTCKLQSNQSIAISVVLNVTFPPRLTEDEFQTAEEGSDVRFVCNVKSNPQAQIMWQKNNSILILEENYQIQQTSESLQLLITQVKKSDIGTYSCLATSPLHRKIKDFHLTVKDKGYTVPIEPIIAACVVVFVTLCFGVVARRKRIMKPPRRHQAGFLFPAFGLRSAGWAASAAIRSAKPALGPGPRNYRYLAGLCGAMNNPGEACSSAPQRGRSPGGLRSA